MSVSTTHSILWVGELPTINISNYVFCNECQDLFLPHDSDDCVCRDCKKLIRFRFRARFPVSCILYLSNNDTSFFSMLPRDSVYLLCDFCCCIKYY